MKSPLALAPLTGESVLNGEVEVPFPFEPLLSLTYHTRLATVIVAVPEVLVNPSETWKVKLSLPVNPTGGV